MTEITTIVTLYFHDCLHKLQNAAYSANTRLLGKPERKKPLEETRHK
jgi:hypothetical protein